MTTINDITQNKPDLSQTKIQEDARSTVVDGSARITPWQGMPVTSDPNSNVKSKPDATSNPGQGFKKTPETKVHTDVENETISQFQVRP